MTERTSAANQVTWVGLFLNVALTALKLLAGIIGHSGAMVADAIHSLSDFATDVVVLVSFRFVGKPADKDHDFGHGKYETLATAIIGGALLLVGAGIFWGGGVKIWHSIKGEHLEAPGGIALLAAVISIVVKEWLYRYTVIVGKRINSQAVIANAWISLAAFGLCYISFAVLPAGRDWTACLGGLILVLTGVLSWDDALLRTISC